MDFKALRERVYQLVVINTLDDINNVKGLYSGTIVGVFGVLFCLGGWLLFSYTGFEQSRLIATLGFYAYMAIIVHHALEIERKKWPNVAYWIPAPLILALIFLMFVLFLFLFDRALALSAFMRLSNAELGFWGTLFFSLPGLIVLAFPLFEWEKLCENTEVDDIVRRMMK